MIGRTGIRREGGKKGKKGTEARGGAGRGEENEKPYLRPLWHSNCDL